MEKIFSNTWRDKRGLPQGEAVNAKIQEQYVDDDQGLQRKHVVDTTLLLHFFGKKGRDELKYEGFNRYKNAEYEEIFITEVVDFLKVHGESADGSAGARVPRVLQGAGHHFGGWFCQDSAALHLLGRRSVCILRWTLKHVFYSFLHTK